MRRDAEKARDYAERLATNYDPQNVAMRLTIDLENSRRNYLKTNETSIFFPKLRLWVPVLPLGWERPTGYRGPPGDARIMLDANELYDIGTEIL